MFVADCPTIGKILIGYGDLRAVVTVAAGVLVSVWHCPACEREHLTASGSVAVGDPVAARAAIDAVRTRLGAARRRGTRSPTERGGIDARVPARHEPDAVSVPDRSPARIAAVTDQR